MTEARSLNFDVLTKAEAAKVLRITKRCLEMHMRQGIAPPMTVVGGRARFRTDVLADWLRDRTGPCDRRVRNDAP